MMRVKFIIQSNTESRKEGTITPATIKMVEIAMASAQDDMIEIDKHPTDTVFLNK